MLSPVGGSPVAQRACAACEDEARKNPIMRKCACGAATHEPCTCDQKKEDTHPEMQIDRAAKAQEDTGTAAINAVDRVINGPGKPLPDGVRGDMEAGFGRSFGHVRVHDTPRAAASAQGIGAHAYTVGNHIAFNRGQYQPGTDSGRFLLAHELAHTVQQSNSPAPAPATGRISQPGDRSEIQANRAATAATTGTTMPALTGGAAPISRYSFREFAGDAAEVGTYAAGGLVGGLLFGDSARDLAEDTADSVIDFASDVYRTAVAIAEEYGVGISIEGTTLVIDVPEFDPCPEFEFDIRLSDFGLDPTLWFPLGPPLPFFTVGIVTLAGQLGVQANLDPGLGFALDGCNFGPAQIRINALSGSASISGALSLDTRSMNQLGVDLALSADLLAIIAWPEPPMILPIPVAGITLGGAFEFMLQGANSIDTQFTANVGLGGASGAVHYNNDMTFVMDMSYGLFGSVHILGEDLCRLGWPLDSHHDTFGANLAIDATAALSRSGVSLSFAAAFSQVPVDPLDDLGFVFDESRMEDDCWLCEFVHEHQLLPRYHGYTWADYSGAYPILPGPEHMIYKRDPEITSGSLCRGTCGPDCAPGACDNDRRDLIVCENRGDHHIWHTYKGYETCGAAQGCLDHDACYDLGADQTWWDFMGFFSGGMRRACDLDAVCTHGFQTSVQWALGGGPQPMRLRYADDVEVTKGCLGRCPETRALEDGSEVEETCLSPRELWGGENYRQRWGREFFNDNIVSGSVPMPYIGRLTYGANAMARYDADIFAELGPLNLSQACLIYNPADMTYTGTADLSLFANIGTSGSITGALEGFLSDPLCFLNWITARGTLNAGIIAQFPTTVTAGVDLFCENGKLMVLPRGSFKTCLDVSAELNAGLDFYLLSFNVWGKEWQLAQKTLQQCWEMDIALDPFIVGQTPNFQLLPSMDLLDGLLDEIFPQGADRDINRTPARNPLPMSPRLLFPCLGNGDDDDDPVLESDCTTPATPQDAIDYSTNPDELRANFLSVDNIDIPGGGSETVGHIMEVKYLQKHIGRGSAPGTQNSIYGNPGIPTKGCFTASKKAEQHFFKGHLLNHNIGGPGTGARGRQNLFPITHRANMDHSGQVEEGVKARVDADKVLYYRVEVTGPRTPVEIRNPQTNAFHGFYKVDSTFLCEVAEYNVCPDGSLEIDPSTRVITPITNNFQFRPSGGSDFDAITDPTAC